MWFPRQVFILCGCICLSVIPYTSHCRLYALHHLFCNTQPNRVPMVICINQMKKLHQKKYSKPWIFFWSVLCQLHVLNLKWILVLTKLIADLFLYRGTAKSYYLINHYLCCICFHHLKLTGMQNQYQDHPDHLRTHEAINCVFWKLSVYFLGKLKESECAIWCE